MQKSSSRSSRSTTKPGLYTKPQPDVIHIYSQAAGDRGRLVIDDHEVPYIQLVDVTATWAGYKPGPEDTPEAIHIAAGIKNGERLFNLSVDDRFMMTALEGEIWRWSWFLANAMAVSAGYTSHGRNSRRINRHGVSALGI